MRIVSLISSATEIICALGRGSELVGRSHECDFPPEITHLPVCTAPRFDARGSSAEIDQRVRTLLQEATSVYRVHADLLRELQPDIIVTQTQCEVCAVSKRDVDEAVCTWLNRSVQVVSLEPNSLADVWRDIERVAAALETSERGQDLAARLQRRMAEIADRAAQAAHRPRVALIEWIHPLMTAGHWMPDLVALAGGINLFGVANQRAPLITWQTLFEADPDVIIAQPCGFDLEITRKEMHVLANQPDWPKLQAVQHGKVFVTDGNQYFNRPGPRLVESLEILAEILHPELFTFGHHGSGYDAFP